MQDNLCNFDRLHGNLVDMANIYNLDMQQYYRTARLWNKHHIYKYRNLRIKQNRVYCLKLQ